jgi:hypothetical protein
MAASKDFSSRNILLNSLLVLVAAFIIYQLYVFGFSNTSESQPLMQVPTAGNNPRSVVQIDVLNGCGAQGVGQKLTSFLRSQGYDVVEMGNYKSFDVKETLVIDRTGNLNVAQNLAALLGVHQKNVVQQISPDYLVTASVVIGKDFKKLNAWKSSH